MTVNFRTVLRDAQSDNFDAEVNAGANPGGLRLWTGTAADGTMIVAFTFAATAFDDAGAAGGNADGVATLNGVPITGTAVASGTVQSADIVRDLAGTPVPLLDCDIPDEITINNATVANGQDLDLTALTYTTPAS